MLDMQFFLHAHQKGNKLYFSIFNFTKKITQINFCANLDFLISFFKGSRWLSEIPQHVRGINLICGSSQVKGMTTTGRKGLTST